jgi:succinate-semialdehyde dehydrogenase / glutarate-semialdehyde dehydrogenase
MAYRSFDPYKQELISEFGSDSDAMLETKVLAAERAARVWRNVQIRQRCDLLINLADNLLAEKETHAAIITREMGKPITQSIGEIEKCALLCRYYAEEAEGFLRPVHRKSAARKGIVTAEPQGVILGVMPWNFPYWQVFRFVVPALASGNSAILKHASNVTGCALGIEEVIRGAGFPESLFRVVLPSHSQIAKLISMPQIRGVALTGSNEAGSVVASLAGKYIKKTVLELGGSDPLVVFGDADIAAAAEGAFLGRFLNNGQSCIAAKRLIVHTSVIDQFTELLAGHMQRAGRGDPALRESFFSPLVNIRAANDIDRQVKEAATMGAVVLTGGGIGNEGPAFYNPAIITDIPPGTPLETEEVFGPVAPIFSFRTAAEASEMANRTNFGLGASVWTSDEEFAINFAGTIDTGTVAVNGFVRSDPGLPFGGVKDSGYGRELSSEGLFEFLNIKSIAVY